MESLNTKDAKIIKENNLTEIEAMDYVERMGYLVESGVMEEKKAHFVVLKEIMRRRRETL